MKEDYVSFETARLLKEKGFNETCYACYEYFSSSVTMYSGWSFEYKGEVVHNSNNVIKCPTHQMAMKWLREIHHLHINVGFGNDYKGEFLYMGDIYDLTNDAIHAKYKPIIEADDYLSDNPKTYEEAVEAAIKYSLENLI